MERSIYLKERPDKDYETDNDLPTPKLTNLKEAIQSLDDVQHFLYRKPRIYRRSFKNWFNSRHSNRLKI